jgi:hypothetical protein
MSLENKQNRILPLLPVALVALTAFSLTGCMAGGTSGTGLSYGGGNRKTSAAYESSHRSNKGRTQYLTLKGRIFNQTGKKLQGVMIQSRTSGSTELSKSDSAGRFSILVVQKGSEPTELLFQHNGREWRTSIPSIGSGEVSFTLERGGKVSVN